MKDKFKEMDPILSDVLVKIINRYEEGRKKYGGSMETNHKPLVTWILDAQEEAIDFVVYLEKVKKLLTGDSNYDKLYLQKSKQRRNAS
jgi:tRNA uridine 5-carbamoylmethylation protein Kti12